MSTLDLEVGQVAEPVSVQLGPRPVERREAHLAASIPRAPRPRPAPGSATTTRAVRRRRRAAGRRCSGRGCPARRRGPWCPRRRRLVLEGRRPIADDRHVDPLVAEHLGQRPGTARRRGCPGRGPAPVLGPPCEEHRDQQRRPTVRQADDAAASGCAASQSLIATPASSSSRASTELGLLPGGRPVAVQDEVEEPRALRHRDRPGRGTPTAAARATSWAVVAGCRVQPARARPGGRRAPGSASTRAVGVPLRRPAPASARSRHSRAVIVASGQDAPRPGSLRRRRAGAGGEPDEPEHEQQPDRHRREGRERRSARRGVEDVVDPAARASRSVVGSRRRGGSRHRRSSRRSRSRPWSGVGTRGGSSSGAQSHERVIPARCIRTTSNASARIRRSTYCKVATEVRERRDERGGDDRGERPGRGRGRRRPTHRGSRPGARPG